MPQGPLGFSRHMSTGPLTNPTVDECIDKFTNLLTSEGIYNIRVSEFSDGAVFDINITDDSRMSSSIDGIGSNKTCKPKHAVLRLSHQYFESQGEWDSYRSELEYIVNDVIDVEFETVRHELPDGVVVSNSVDDGIVIRDGDGTIGSNDYLPHLEIKYTGIEPTLEELSTLCGKVKRWNNA